jgi:hypothetical protein
MPVIPITTLDFHSAFVANGPYVRYVGLPRMVGVTLGYNF